MQTDILGPLVAAWQILSAVLGLWLGLTRRGAYVAASLVFILGRGVLAMIGLIVPDVFKVQLPFNPSDDPVYRLGQNMDDPVHQAFPGDPAGQYQWSAILGGLLGQLVAVWLLTAFFYWLLRSRSKKTPDKAA